MNYPQPNRDREQEIRQPVSPSISLESLWNCDIPPLGAIAGRFPLRDQNIPAYLRETVNDMRQAALTGTRLIILDTFERANHSDMQACFEANEDIEQLLRCGVAHAALVVFLL